MYSPFVLLPRREVEIVISVANVHCIGTKINYIAAVSAISALLSRPINVQ